MTERKNSERTIRSSIYATNLNQLEAEQLKIIGMHGGLSEVISLSKRAAMVESTVFLQGETGVGKDVIANYIHAKSDRRFGPFVKVNCGAIPDSLIDSELFGHEKGSFTGATSSKKGKFENAEKGTIFLDEIAELSLQAQVRLLRVLQNREIERIGAGCSKKVDIRIIAATHQNLKALVHNGDFREDLYYRLNIFQIDIPPLRERMCDIPDFLDYFTKVKCRELFQEHPFQFSDEFIKKVYEYDWPGNVRELENTIERTLATGIESTLTTRTTRQKPKQQVPEVSDEFMTLDNLVRNYIVAVLEKTGGKINGKDGAAALLSINPNTLRSKMRKLGIRIEKRLSD